MSQPLSVFLQSLPPVVDPVEPPEVATLSALLSAFGGRSFGDKVYRVHTEESAGAYTAMIDQYFPQFAGRARCFGYDWLGRQFALDAERNGDDGPHILEFEPGTGQVLEIPVGLGPFHSEELVEFADDVVAKHSFQAWLAQGSPAPEWNQCVGYIKPLFLGGQDELQNLEISDMDVYWTTTGQLLSKVRGLPVGTPIDRISFS